MIILCLDLALSNTGCAVIELGQQDTLLYVETIKTTKADKDTLKRLKIKVADDDWSRTTILFKGITRLIDKYQPEHVFIECPTGGSKSAFAAKAMALAKGVACAAVEQYSIKSTLITPFAAKKAATGSTDATKTQVKQVVEKLFPKFNGWVKSSNGKLLIGANEHIFDALSVYMAAAKTQSYKELKHGQSASNSSK